jgi:hypothetical protein
MRPEIGLPGRRFGGHAVSAYETKPGVIITHRPFGTAPYGCQQSSGSGNEQGSQISSPQAWMTRFSISMCRSTFSATLIEAARFIGPQVSSRVALSHRWSACCHRRMRKTEVEVLRHFRSLGLPARRVAKTIDWNGVRQQLSDGTSPQEAAQRHLTRIAASAFSAPLIAWLPVPSPGDILEGAGAILEGAGAVVEAVLPPRPPLPVGFSTELDLVNCRVQLIGQVADGDYMKIDVSNNGTLPFDDSGVVEIITEPDLPSPPGGSSSSNSITGNGSLTLAGPRTVWVHLKGEEDAATVEVTIFNPSRK